MVLAKSNSKPPDRRVIAPVFNAEIVLVTLISMFGFTALLMGLDWAGYLSSTMAFLGSKAMIAIQGPEPSFAATGYGFPPLLIYGSALLGSPITLQVLSATFLVGLVTRTMQTVSIHRFWQTIWLLLIFVHPAFGLMLLRDPAWILSTLFLFLIFKLMLQLIDPERRFSQSFLVVMLGLIFSGLIQLRFEAWGGLICFLLILWCFLQEETWQYRTSALFVVSTMCLFSIGTCCYLNWLAADDPLAFLHQTGSGLRLAGLDPFWVRSSFGDGVMTGMTQMLQIVPIYVFLAVGLIWQSQFSLCMALLLALPTMLLAISIWQGLYVPNLSQFGMYLTFVPLLLQRIQPIPQWRKFVVTLGLVISLFSSGWVLQNNQVIPEEILLWQTLTRQDISLVPAVQRLDQQMHEQRAIASFLFENQQPDERILIDDSIHFPILYLRQSTEGLILPHQYEFNVAIEYPPEWVDYIVMSGAKSPLRRQDLVRVPFAQRMNGDPESGKSIKLQGFQTVFDSSYYQVLQRS